MRDCPVFSSIFVKETRRLEVLTVGEARAQIAFSARTIIAGGIFALAFTMVNYFSKSGEWISRVKIRLTLTSDVFALRPVI